MTRQRSALRACAQRLVFAVAPAAFCCCHALNPYKSGDARPSADGSPGDARPRDVAQAQVVDAPGDAQWPDGDFQIVIVDGGEVCLTDESLWYRSCVLSGQSSCAVACGLYQVSCTGSQCHCGLFKGGSRKCVDFSGLNGNCSLGSSCFAAIRDTCCSGL